MQRKIRGLQRDPKSGIWQCDKIVRGIRICESTGTRDADEAERYLARRIEEVRQQAIYGVRPIRTFRQAATKYLTEFDHKRSIRRDAGALSDLDPFIGDLRLDRVHMDALQPYIAARAHLRWATIVRNLAVVRRILILCARAWRYENGLTWLEQAPLLLLQRKGEKGKARPAYPLDWDEQRLLFSELGAYLERMAMFTVNTGTRDHEVCSLRWEWEQNVIGVGSVFVVPGDEVKNIEPRVIVLNDVAQAIVEEQRGRHATHVFCYAPPVNRIPRRRPRVPRSPWPVTRMHNTSWRKARVRAAARYEAELGRPCPTGFRRIRVHDLKHTFGRRLRAAGVAFEDRQDLLGHKNGKITTHYSQAEIAELKRKANLVNELRSSSVLLRVVGGEARKRHG